MIVIKFKATESWYMCF